MRLQKQNTKNRAHLKTSPIPPLSHTHIHTHIQPRAPSNARFHSPTVQRCLKSTLPTHTQIKCSNPAWPQLVSESCSGLSSFAKFTHDLSYLLAVQDSCEDRRREVAKAVEVRHPNGARFQARGGIHPSQAITAARP